jgi:3-hydroxyisobutyrate dehydrogenase-like beta-hydroxyacid dehydrogenase
VARVLIIGCGCRGLALAGGLLAAGHAVRGTTRDAGRLAEIEAAGAEPVLGDPDRVGTLFAALDGVGVVCVLLGSAVGAADAVAALHGTRLEMLMMRTIDTTVRGVVYEAAGTVDAEVLAHGAQRVAAACDLSRIPYRLLNADPGDHASWAAAAQDCVETVLAA